jgi:hypothetical protein
MTIEMGPLLLQEGRKIELKSEETKGLGMTY